MGILWAQLLLQFCTHCFETLHVFFSWYELCMWIGHNCWINFCHFFDIVNLVIFYPDYIVRGYLLWAQLLLQFCTCPIVFKLCMCFPHGMRMCMWIGHNCWINFCHFFDIVNLVIFHPDYIDRGYLLLAQLLLQFCTNCFETLHVLFSWYEDVHVDWT